MEDSIGRDNLEIALKRAESEQRDRKTSEHSGSVSPVKAGSRQNLERSLSQETSTPKKSSNPQSRQNSVLPKEEKKEAEETIAQRQNPALEERGVYVPWPKKVRKGVNFTNIFLRR